MRRTLPRIGLILALGAILLGGGATASLASSAEDAFEAARRVPEIAELLEAHPDAELVAMPTEDGGWVVEVVLDGTEIGSLALSADLEPLSLRAESSSDEPADENDQSLLDILIPRPEGAAFLWAALGVVLFVVWPRAGWAGPVLAGGLVGWGLVWLLFWRYTDQAQLVLWTVNLVVLTVATIALIRGAPPLLWTRGRRLGIQAGFLTAVAALAWLTLEGGAIEDSAIWGTRGGRYFVDNLEFPYGVLGEGATYGPVQYLIHAPLTILWPPDSIGAESFTAARVVALLALVALAAGVLVAVGRRTAAGAAAGLAVLLLPWFASTVHAVNVSQLVPIAFTVWAFTLVVGESRNGAITGGAMLALGAGAMFVPAFAAPAFLVAAGRQWRLALGSMAAVGIGVTGLMLLTGVDLGTFWSDTWSFQESAYAAEGGLSMWGRFGWEEARWIGKVLHGMLLVFAAVGQFRNQSDSAAFVAAGVSIGGVLLWKGHIGPWGYLTWFVPLLVIGAILAQVHRQAAKDALRASVRETPWQETVPGSE